MLSPGIKFNSGNTRNDMKKSIKATKASPAPATPALAPKSAPKSASAAPKTTTEAPKTFGKVPKTTTEAPRIVPASPPIRAESASPKSSIPIVISARINIGFGNALYIRGEGPGLSWNKGTLLDCVSADLWKISLKGGRPVVFKFLINDEIWNTGDDLFAELGSDSVYTPSF